MLIKSSFRTAVFAFICFSWNFSMAQRPMQVEGRVFIHTPRKSNAPQPLPNRNAKYRTYDGTFNNIGRSKTELGSTDIMLAREIPANYGTSDKLNALSGENRPSARQISNELCNEPTTTFSERGLSAAVYVWGQFLDHDINLTPTGSTESEPILLPTDEAIFTFNIPFSRSVVADGTGVNNTKREQINLVTAWVDASNVYGSDETRAKWLRTMKDGKMKVSNGNLLPYNTLTGELDSSIDPNAPSMANDENKTKKTFVAGDIRAAEHPALTSFHTIFVREHNLICNRLKTEGLRNDEEIFQMARKEVSGLIQAITYKEFLPAMGVNSTPYRGYNPNVNPNIVNTFATAAYRLGHTMVADDIVIKDGDCTEVGPGELDLLDVFWNPSLLQEYKIDYFLKGLAVHTQYETDLKVNSVLRNFLFGDPSAAVRFGLDLASINIQRGRDHGLPDYNTMRKIYTGKSVKKFAEISTNPEVVASLQSLYGDVNNIDLWVGLLAEDRLPGKSVGKTIHEMLKVQFEKLRDGDFYFYKNDPFLSNQVKNRIDNTTLQQILIRNTDISSFQQNVFFTEPCEDEANQPIVTRTMISAESERLFPNPASNEITLRSVNSKLPVSLNIVTSEGKTIKTINYASIDGDLNIDISNITPGLYIIQLTSNEKKESFKFIKQKE